MDNREGPEALTSVGDTGTSDLEMHDAKSHIGDPRGEPWNLDRRDRVRYYSPWGMPQRMHSGRFVTIHLVHWLISSA